MPSRANSRTSTRPGWSKQRPCYITYTNERVHDILRDGL